MEIPETTSTDEIEHSTSTVQIENDTTKVIDKSSQISLMCRVCYDDAVQEPIIAPCWCKGYTGLIHKSCLERWLAESNTNRCEICHHPFQSERHTRFRAAQSVWHWLRYHPMDMAFPVRGIRGDILACTIITPLCIIVSYICLYSADYYNKQKFATVPAARWTSISLLIMILIMIFGYFVWVYLIVRYHSRVWYYWWQRECVVRVVIPPEASININR